MNLDYAPLRIRRFWQAFDPEGVLACRFYEPFRVGFEDVHADAGALRILDGSKTSTSSLLWEYEESGRAMPYEGSLSVLLDGRHMPVCIVETTRLEVIPFAAVSPAFCAAYAESDGTVEGWRALNWPIFNAQCREFGRTASMDMPLVCETFTVVHPRDTAAQRARAQEILARHCDSRAG